MKNKTIARITLNAFIIALIATVSFIPNVGYISLIGGQISFTTIHILVLLFAILFGVREGTMAGLFFGLFSLIRAVTMPVSILDPLFINPLVSVFPRLMFGLLAGLVFDGIRMIKKSRALRNTLMFISLPVLTLFHSFLTLSMLWAFNYNNAALAGETYWTVLGLIISINGLIETASALILTPLLAYGIFSGIKGMTFLPLKRELFMKEKTRFRKLMESHYETAIEKIGELVAIESTYDEETIDSENPFGKKVSSALQYVEEMAKKDNFQVKNYNNQVVEIIYGEGEKNVTIMAHADVVPATGDWTGQPYKMRRTKTHLYGRGVADDKGPLIAAYYAFKMLRDNSLIHGYQVRMLVGGNEERGSACMEYYFKTLKKKQPTFGFSPDASWPLIFAEKGICNFVVSGELNISHIYEIRGGVATNAVIERCLIVTDDPELEKFIKKYSKKYNIETINGKIHITVIGKSAHGSTPEFGVNAGMQVLQSVAEYSGNSKLTQLVNAYLPLDASGLKADAKSKVMGHNSLNVGTINYDGSILKLDVNFRHVEIKEFAEFKAIIEQNSPYSVEFAENSPLLYFGLDNPLIVTLMKSYTEETGDFKSKPLAIGGGTYAKEADNVVAFGMEGKANESRMHDADENIRIKNLKDAMTIYANAIDKLGDLCK